jgi:acyl-CoA synthetase (NDP forming)
VTFPDWPADPVPPPVTPEWLRDFFAPKSIALVGASDTSGWARFIVASSATVGYAGPLITVHPGHATAFGKPTVPSLRDLPEPVDLAFILAPVQAVESVLDDAGAAGVRSAIVLASGYREVGQDGRVLEDQMIARARENAVTVLGPNCLGFVNAHARSAPFALTVPKPLTAGPVGIALQSGALASVVLAFARSRAIGVSTLATMGNESMISTLDVLDYLVEDENTRVICLFLEEIGDLEKFARAAGRADQAGKPIVALKVGSSAAGQRAALAHTGSVAGDDAVVGAVLRQLNVIRVTSIEDLLCTAALLGYDRWPRGRRMGVLTASGGACDIIADSANAQGIEIPDFAPETAAAIAPHLPPFAAAKNPLDVTGYVLANARVSTLTPIDRALDAAVQDPGLDFVLFSGVNLPDARPPDESVATIMEGRVAWLRQRMASSPVPVIPVGSTCVDLSEYGRQLLDRHHIHLLGGMELGIRALGHALRWVENHGHVWAGPGPGRGRGRNAASSASPRTKRGRPPFNVLSGASSANYVSPADGAWSEDAARSLLSDCGVPVVPAELVHSADEAVEAARRVGLPAAAKVCSAQIAHKSDIGGVALGLDTDAAVRAGYEQVVAAGRSVPGARIDGVLVSAMRTGGVELLAGVTMDPAFGPVLALGLGGIWVEVLSDTSLRVLPVDAGEVKRMLTELRGLPLLRGARGSRPADLDVLAKVISVIGDTAMSFNGALRALEVNPLWVNGDHVEALDVLVVTEPANAAETELTTC